MRMSRMDECVCVCIRVHVVCALQREKWYVRMYMYENVHICIHRCIYLAHGVGKGNLKRAPQHFGKGWCSPYFLCQSMHVVS